VLAGLEPAPGVIKAEVDDFIVEELPLYPADGAGTHTYFQIEKRGISTHHAVHLLAAALNVFDIGYAGLKDARAVARQWISVEHVEPAVVASIAVPRISVLQVTRHRNKLKLGHLRGNRFEIRVRHTDARRAAELAGALDELSRRGAPNYFGPQRFGNRGDSWQIGRSIVAGDTDAAVDLILGRPGPHDNARIRLAREHYDAGRYDEAARTWPGNAPGERRALRVLARGEKKRRAFHALDRDLRGLYVSAFQSWLFNQTVALRIGGGLERLLPGDLAWLHANGAVFRVRDPAVEQPRADAFEISPTGPLFGYRMTQPDHQAGCIEADVLAAAAVTPEAFRGERLRVKGARRPLRFQPADVRLRVGSDARGEYVMLEFTLPRGCYATALLGELFAGASELPEAVDDDA
jgi:tRNA pseudouridine13 synthase